MTPDIEEWRPVVGYSGSYEVSNRGRVRSMNRTITRSDGQVHHLRGCVLRPATKPSGHLEVCLRQNAKGAAHSVHRLVLEAFVGPCPDGMECCHEDGDPANNRLENLRWDTRHANRMDNVRHGNHFPARITHCPRGHEYTPENTRRHGNFRHCRACNRDRQRAKYWRNKEAASARLTSARE